MFVHKSKIRIRYAETDQMGYVYYGNYATFYEVARVEALRSLNFSYNELEKSGIMLPVLELQIKYVKPAFYDDEIVIETTITDMPKARIKFEYKTFNQKGELLNFGNTTLVFVDVNSKKPTQAPKELLEKLEKFIESK
jgi:acyl-CoA thioester hydrolase